MHSEQSVCLLLLSSSSLEHRALLAAPHHSTHFDVYDSLAALLLLLLVACWPSKSLINLQRLRRVRSVIVQSENASQSASPPACLSRWTETEPQRAPHKPVAPVVQFSLFSPTIGSTLRTHTTNSSSSRPSSWFLPTQTRVSYRCT